MRSITQVAAIAAALIMLGFFYFLTLVFGKPNE